MNEKIRKHVNSLFEGAPNTKRVYDLKDEIISNATDKYEDLIKEGKTEEESFEKAIREIGDVNELIKELERTNPMNREENERQRKKTALVVSISVGLYILSLISCVILDEIGADDFIVAPAFFVLAGIPTCILIYHFMSKPKYSKYEDTMVEEFKEWKQKDNQENEIRKTINSIIWTLTVVIYLFISFTFNNWYISWIIFIIAALVENVVKLLFKLGER